ncbi:MAG: hypothetical protein ACOYN4_07635 [Bacteroidales bacterium]
MSKETYSIPSSPTARFDYQRNAVETCTANASLWKITTDRLTKIAPLRADYELKYAVTNNPSTQSPGATAARDAAWDLYVVALVDLYDHDILNNDAIPANGKDALHIHFTSTGGGTSASAPTTTPMVTLTAEEISILHVVFADSATPGSHSKPANVAFLELVFNIELPAATPDDCTQRANITRSHEAMIFTPAQRGKTVYAYSRWVNRNGKFGPWSGMITAIVP